MRPSSLGGGRILRRTLSVCLSVCLSVRPSRARMYFVYICAVLRANIQNRKTSVLDYGPASRMYFSARAEGRISYGHLGRTSLLKQHLLICSRKDQLCLLVKLLRYSIGHVCDCYVLVADGFCLFFFFVFIVSHLFKFSVVIHFFHSFVIFCTVYLE